MTESIFPGFEPTCDGFWYKWIPWLVSSCMQGLWDFIITRSSSASFSAASSSRSLTILEVEQSANWKSAGSCSKIPSKIAGGLTKDVSSVNFARSWTLYGVAADRWLQRLSGRRWSDLKLRNCCRHKAAQRPQPQVLTVNDTPMSTETQSDDDWKRLLACLTLLTAICRHSRRNLQAIFSAWPHMKVDRQAGALLYMKRFAANTPF